LSANGQVLGEVSWNATGNDFATSVAWQPNSGLPLWAVGATVQDFGDPGTWTARYCNGTTATGAWQDLPQMDVAWDVAAVGQSAVIVGEAYDSVTEEHHTVVRHMADVGMDSRPGSL